MSPRSRPDLRAVALLAALSACGCDGRPGIPPPAAPPAAPSAAAPVRPPLPAGRVVPDGEPEAVAELERFLRPPARRRPCGPYRLLSDLSPARLVGIERFCATLAGTFEEEVAARLGVAPAHPPRGTIVLFASRRRYRDAVTSTSDLPQGYAAWSDARSGTVALPAGDVADDELAATLAHELAHLAERRLFGFPRPRWLSEGLADAIGDSATSAGFRKLEGFVGVEAQRRRWLAMARGARARWSGSSPPGRSPSITARRVSTTSCPRFSSASCCSTPSSHRDSAPGSATRRCSARRSPRSSRRSESTPLRSNAGSQPGSAGGRHRSARDPCQPGPQRRTG